jgi:hypothetical protein
MERIEERRNFKLALRPTPTSFLTLKQEIEAKKFKATFKITF